MNRNVESHFSLLPSADISRSRFDRSQDIKFTFNVGELVPFFVDEVLPGDTFNITTSKVVRLQTLLYPIMDNMYLDTYFFFVPNRLVWTHWRELMGENTQSAWLPEVEYSVPQILFRPASDSGHGSGKVAVGDILDYMGVPTGIQTSSSTDNFFGVSALPYRAYCKIFNDWFRDENLTDPVNFNDGDSDEDYYSLQDNSVDKPFLAAKYHDYFTSCLPAPQKGPNVIVPFSDDGRLTFMPVMSINNRFNPLYYTTGEVQNRPVHIFKHASADSDESYRASLSAVPDGGSSAPFVGVPHEGSDVPGSTIGAYFDNLYTRINFEDTHGGIDVNDLRYAFQLQKLYERDARGGTRYIELIKSHFNVDSPDARLQRSEYLGGNRVALNIHQITNQSQGETDFLGDVGAMSLTTDKHSDFTKSFTEHGFLIGICCVRYDHSYPQGLERFWSRKSRFDFYWPVFANLGEQAVYKKEIALQTHPTAAGLQAVFGYQERWAEYRYKPNRVSAEMRPDVSNNLAAWHLADKYTQVPSLSDSWIREDKSVVDRVLAVTSAVSDQIFADIYVQNYTTRPLPLYSIPGLIDHH